MLQRRWLLLALATFVALALASAGVALAVTNVAEGGGRTPMVKRVSSSDNAAPPPTPVEPVARKNMDQLLAEVDEIFPGFGGMHLSKDNNVLYVYLLDPSEKAGLEEAIAKVFGRDRIPPGGIQVVLGQYSITQLEVWYDRIRATVLTLRGVTASTDLDEGNNRLYIGLKNREMRESVEQELARQGIPPEAVIIQVEGPLEFLGHTVQSEFRPLEAGIQTDNEQITTDPCTLGFLTLRSGVEGFVTPHHCTPRKGEGADLSKVHQPVAPNKFVGVETIDPFFFTNADNPNCPQGQKCRHSDSAFIDLDELNVSIRRGAIARTTSQTIDPNNPILTVDHNQFRFRIVAESVASVDQIVHKVGRTTGWTSGTVTRTCVHTPAPNNITYLCQDRANSNFIAEGGDSGAPFFLKTDSPQAGDVKIYGILIGRITLAGGGSEIVFSPLGNIYLDLGPFETWDTCDLGLAC